MPSFSSLKVTFSLAAILGGLALCGTADAQSGLPACPIDPSIRLHNCWGNITFPNGAKYVGAFKDGKREGQGTYTYQSGAEYVGAWKDSKFEGSGTFTFSDGSKYVGKWKNNERDGLGAFYGANGSVLQAGIWANDKFVRSASVTTPTASAPPAAPKSGSDGQSEAPACPKGYGVKWHNCYASYTLPNGDIYSGQWSNNTYNGWGRFKFRNGKSYEGFWKDGYRHGQGIEYAPDGSILKMGIWAGGELARSASVPALVAPAPPPAAPKSSSGSGSAFRIANGQFVTNHHVIDGCTTLKIDGNSGARVVASDPTRDLALVSIANDRGEVASIRTTRIQLNESITAAGFPLDGAFTGIAITNGTVSRLSGLRGDTGEV